MNDFITEQPFYAALLLSGQGASNKKTLEEVRVLIQQQDLKPLRYEIIARLVRAMYEDGTTIADVKLIKMLIKEDYQTINHPMIGHWVMHNVDAVLAEARSA